MCQRVKPALWRHPTQLGIIVPATGTTGDWDSLDSAGSGAIEGMIDSYGAIPKATMPNRVTYEGGMQCVTVGRDLGNI